MSDEEESKHAIEALNGSEYMGVKITVEASHSKVRPKPGNEIGFNEVDDSNAAIVNRNGWQRTVLPMW